MSNEPSFTSWDALEPSDLMDGHVRAQAFNGQRSQLCRFQISEHVTALPPINHVSEQLSVVIRGRLRVRIGTVEQDVGPGDLFRVPQGVEHEATVIAGPVEILDFHTPPRLEFVQ